MANRSQLDLKTFEMSSQAYHLSLLMTSVAFIYDIQPCHIPKNDLSALILSKHLWLLPRGPCRLDMHVRLGERDDGWKTRLGFLEFVADKICRSFIWCQLGLNIQILDIQLHQEDDGTPNLYFAIEQPDMSSALLTPPNSYTAQFKGLECILRLELPDPLDLNCMKGVTADIAYSSLPDWMDLSTEDPTYHHTINLSGNEKARLWDVAACLIEGALGLTLGVRKRMRGVTIFEPQKAPSLLNLAPTIFNSRYLKSTMIHTKHFGVITNILASSPKGQSPELRHKATELLKGDGTEPDIDRNDDPNISPKDLELPIQRLLWNVLQNTLSPTIKAPISNTTSKAIPTVAALDDLSYDIDETTTEDQSLSLHPLYSADSSHYDSLLLPTEPNYDTYRGNVSDNHDPAHTWQLSWDPGAFSLESQTAEAYGAQNEMADHYVDSTILGDEPLEFSTPFPESYLSHTRNNYLPQDYSYDDYNNFDRCNHHYADFPDPKTADYMRWQSHSPRIERATKTIPTAD